MFGRGPFSAGPFTAESGDVPITAVGRTSSLSAIVASAFVSVPTSVVPHLAAASKAIAVGALAVATSVAPPRVSGAIGDSPVSYQPVAGSADLRVPVPAACARSSARVAPAVACAPRASGRSSDIGIGVVGLAVEVHAASQSAAFFSYDTPDIGVVAGDVAGIAAQSSARAVALFIPPNARDFHDAGAGSAFVDYGDFVGIAAGDVARVSGFGSLRGAGIVALSSVGAHISGASSAFARAQIRPAGATAGYGSARATAIPGVAIKASGYSSIAARRKLGPFAEIAAGSSAFGAGALAAAAHESGYSSQRGKKPPPIIIAIVPDDHCLPNPHGISHAIPLPIVVERPALVLPRFVHCVALPKKH